MNTEDNIYENHELLRFLEDLKNSGYDVGRGVTRGVVSNFLGLPGDTADLMDMVSPDLTDKTPTPDEYRAMVRGDDPNPEIPLRPSFLPNSEEWSRSLSNVYPKTMGNKGQGREAIAEALGGLVTPGPEELLTVGKVLGPSILGGTGLYHFASGDISDLKKAAGPMADQLGAVKPKGGNWFESNSPFSLPENKGVHMVAHWAERHADQRRWDDAYEQLAKEFADNGMGSISDLDPQVRDDLLQEIADQMAENERGPELMTDWFKRTPLNWRRKFLGTSEDPVIDVLKSKGEFSLRDYPTPIDDWEQYGDSLIDWSRKEDWFDPEAATETLGGDWWKKVPEDERFYELKASQMAGQHGSDITDVYRQVAEALMEHPEKHNPEFWKNLSFPKAMGLTIDKQQAELAKQLANSDVGTSLIHEYPDKFRWVDINGGAVPEDIGDIPVEETTAFDGSTKYHTGYNQSVRHFQTYDTPEEAIAARKEAMQKENLREALKKEGDLMGHCVGGYCSDVENKTSQIVSLRDSKGRPHVTIELNPARPGIQDEEYQAEVNDAVDALLEDYYDGGENVGQDLYDFIHGNPEEWAQGHYGELSPEELADRFYGEKIGADLNEGFRLYVRDNFIWDIERNPEHYGIRPPQDVGNLNLPDVAQIRGKENAVPAEKYRQYVKDFLLKNPVNSVMDDVQPFGLVKLSPHFQSPAIQDAIAKTLTARPNEVGDYILNFYKKARRDVGNAVMDEQDFYDYLEKYSRGEN